MTSYHRIPLRYFLDGDPYHCFRFRYIPCLNEREDHVDFLVDLARRHLGGWVEDWDSGRAAAEAAASRERALALAYPNTSVTVI